MAQNHARSSVCSFLYAHYETLALDIAVSEHGRSRVVVVPSWDPTERVVFPCAGVAINHCPSVLIWSPVTISRCQRQHNPILLSCLTRTTLGLSGG
jgi:hypothetical protein